MMEFKVALEAIDPRLWWLSITLFIYALIWIWRWVSPKLPTVLQFENVPSQFKPLPALAIGAVLGATGMESQEIARILLDLVLGSISGVTAVGGHETLARLMGGSPSAPSTEV